MRNVWGVAFCVFLFFPGKEQLFAGTPCFFRRAKKHSLWSIVPSSHSLAFVGDPQNKEAFKQRPFDSFYGYHNIRNPEKDVKKIPEGSMASIYIAKQNNEPLKVLQCALSLMKNYQMKKTGMILCLLALSLLQAAAQADKGSQKLLRHVVMFSFKEGSTPDQIKKVTDAFSALPKKIKEIKGYEWGTNNSPENLNQGFTHCFIVNFASEEDRAIYLPHPEHKAFGKILTPVLDKVLVIDYWTK